MIYKTNFSSLRVGKISRGCELCVQGKKLVLFITGLCDRRCWYCSLSKKRFLVDKTWANERQCKSIKDAIKEAQAMEAKGCGITGGNPLLVLNRTLKYASTLKKNFRNFHIHIYLPTDIVTARKLSALSKYIDEIRFHPSFLLGKNIEKNIKEDIEKIKIASLFFKKHQIGCEIPAIPGKEKETKKFIQAAKQHISFLNINELEFSDTNMEELEKIFGKRLGYVVKSSEATAKKLLKFCDKIGLRTHYCSAATKSIYQYKNRLARLARHVKKPYDIVTETCLLRAALYLPETKPGFDYEKQLKKKKEKKLKRKILKKLEKKFFELRKIIKGELDKEKLRILTSAFAVLKKKEKIKKLGLLPALVEELPTADHTLLRLDWL